MSTELPELPELPAGYFWRVGPKEGYDRRNIFSPRMFGVSIRKKRLIGSNPIWYSDPTHPEGVPAAAWEVFYDWTSHRKSEDAKAAVTGDYPPRVWGENAQ